MRGLLEQTLSMSLQFLKLQCLLSEWELSQQCRLCYLAKVKLGHTCMSSFQPLLLVMLAEGFTKKTTKLVRTLGGRVCNWVVGGLPPLIDHRNSIQYFDLRVPAICNCRLQKTILELIDCTLLSLQTDKFNDNIKQFVGDWMEPAPKMRSVSEIDRQIEQNLNTINQLKEQGEWIGEYNKTDKPPPKTPKYHKSISYYKQFWKTYLVNEMIITKAKELNNQNKELAACVTNIEDLLKERAKMLTERYQKKKRRTSSEINKAYKCPYPDCSKRYGCDVSMNLHIKLKHLGGNKTERQQLARDICQAEMNGQPYPQITLIFPPGYLDQFKEEYQERLRKTGQLKQT